MFLQHEIDGAESSSQPARTRTLGSIPSQLDAEQAAAQAGQLERDAQAQPANAGRLEAATAGPGSRQDTATGEGLWSASRASAPSLVY